ncbi:hypothetical protein Pd630_LPD03754 [Rhodococcus opacus PD630]|nr:hypothetical protein Pd630_LPD03754 [Rhodococcus opacus PD630]
MIVAAVKTRRRRGGRRRRSLGSAYGAAGWAGVFSMPRCAITGHHA